MNDEGMASPLPASWKMSDHSKDLIMFSDTTLTKTDSFGEIEENKEEITEVKD